MPSLIVSLDGVALLRQARRDVEPDPAAAAVLAEMGGADALSLHLRGDRRHTQERDVNLVRELSHAPLILSLAPTQEMVQFAYASKPRGVTLLPERRNEAVTEGGLDVLLDESHLKKIVRALTDLGVDVGLLVEPDLDQVKAVNGLNANTVVFNARAYAQATVEREVRDQLERIESAARVARKLGLRVRAAHGLNLRNVTPLVGLNQIDEIQVGHGVVSRAIFLGLDAAVREIKSQLRAG